MLPPSDRPYRVDHLPGEDGAPGQVVVASAISRRKHDEALRELLLQLAIADLATLIAASLVGYGVARAALRPVERYRVAAERAQGAPVLPVDPGGTTRSPDSDTRSTPSWRGSAPPTNASGSSSPTPPTSCAPRSR